MKRRLLWCAVVLFSIGFSKMAGATPVTFFGQDNTYHGITNASAAESAFLSALTGGYQTENFESFSVGKAAPLSLDFGTFGAATLNGVGSIKDNDTVLIGRWPTSGTKYWDTSTYFTINFSQPVYAFGFYATDIGDGVSGGDLVLTLSNGNILNVNNLVPAVNGNGLYFGFYETDLTKGITSISFIGATNADFFGFDDMTVGMANPVPEPATMLLFGAGLAGLAGIGARRSRKK